MADEGYMKWHDAMNKTSLNRSQAITPAKLKLQNEKLHVEPYTNADPNSGSVCALVCSLQYAISKTQKPTNADSGLVCSLQYAISKTQSVSGAEVVCPTRLHLRRCVSAVLSATLWVLSDTPQSCTLDSVFKLYY